MISTGLGIISRTSIMRAELAPLSVNALRIGSSASLNFNDEATPWLTTSRRFNSFRRACKLTRICSNERRISPTSSMPSVLSGWSSLPVERVLASSASPCRDPVTERRLKRRDTNAITPSRIIMTEMGSAISMASSCASCTGTVRAIAQEWPGIG